MQSACVILYCNLWPVLLYHIFPHYLVTGTIFGKKKLLNIEYVFWFSLHTLSETFLIVTRIKRNIIINLHSFSCKYPLFFSDFNKTWIFRIDFRKICIYRIPWYSVQWWAELFHDDKQKDEKTERAKLIAVFRNFANAPKKNMATLLI